MERESGPQESRKLTRFTKKVLSRNATASQKTYRRKQEFKKTRLSNMCVCVHETVGGGVGEAERAS
jgi:hypothetical protein